MRTVPARIGRVPLRRWRRLAWNEDGPDTTLQGVAFTRDAAEAIALRAALAGTVNNPDEPVIPVVDPSGPTGYFRPSSIATEVGPSWVNIDATLAKVSADKAPPVTVGLLGHVRSNAHGIAAAGFHHSVPAGAEWHSWLPTGTASTGTRPTASGPAAGGVAYRRVTAGSGQTIARYAVAPDRWFRGCCHVETQAGGRWVPVVGRRSLEAPWRAGNGLVQVELVEGGSTSGRLRVGWWRADAQGWVTREFGIRAGGADTAGWRSVEVTHLSAHQVVLRARAARAEGRTTLTMALTRGSRVVACSLDTDALGDHRVRALPAEAVVDDTNHAYSAEGAGGHRWLFMAADDFDVNTADGVFTPGAAIAPQWSFGLGAFFVGASGDSGSREQTWRQWFAVQSRVETLR